MQSGGFGTPSTPAEQKCLLLPSLFSRHNLSHISFLSPAQRPPCPSLPASCGIHSSHYPALCLKQQHYPSGSPQGPMLVTNTTGEIHMKYTLMSNIHFSLSDINCFILLKALGTEVPTGWRVGTRCFLHSNLLFLFCPQCSTADG